ncbi:MAG TPA: hypothetical protein PKG60_00935 [Spirochaetota bacterium]|nr:hypothetical protein [Spirochaetota bacterium]
MVIRNFDVDNVIAGTDYIEAYVQYFKKAEGEEGHGHVAAGGESTDILILFFISTMFFSIRYFKAKKVN